MKYFKILLFLISFSSISNAEIIRNVLLDTNEDLCIYNNYYVFDEEYHAQTIDGDWYAGGTADIPMILRGYQYDTETNVCSRDLATKYGLTNEGFNFLLALIGVIFGGVFMFFTVQLFVNVGGKR